MPITIHGTNGITWPSGDTQADYDVGTFTTTITDGTNFASNSGNYVKIGDYVFIDIYFANKDLSGFNTNAIYITDLPFSTSGVSAGVDISYQNLQSTFVMTGYVGSSVLIYLLKDGTQTLVTGADISRTTGRTIMVSASYKIT